jgi:hypothetical protein
MMKSKLGFHLYMMDREHEHISEATDTSGWEIAVDAVVVRIATGLQEYRRMFGPKFARKAIGFPCIQSISPIIGGWLPALKPLFIFI